MTLTRDALVRFSDILYLIFKFAAALWQSFYDHIRPFGRVHGTDEKQTLTDLVFVLRHDGYPTDGPHHQTRRGRTSGLAPALHDTLSTTSSVCSEG